MINYTYLLNLPGGDLVVKGIKDLHEGKETIESLLVLVASPRLKNLKFDLPTVVYASNHAHKLYELIEIKHGKGAHSKYNSFIRRIISFARLYSSQYARQLNQTTKP